MSIPLATLSLRDWQNGLNDSASNSILPDNYLRYCMNCYTDEADDNMLGDIKGRKGYTIINAQIQDNKSILGLGNFVDKTGTPARLIATVNNSGDTYSLTYYDTGSAWAQIGPAPTNFTASLKMRFDTFLDYIFATNGTDAVMTWNGDTTANWGTDEAVSAPTGTLIKNFYDRMNIAGNSTYRSRIYYSSIPNATNNISWTSGNGYIDINPDDNDSITALEPNGSVLLVFKKRSIFTWTGTQTTADKLIDIGTVSQETVQTIKGVTIFFGETYGNGAVFMYTGTYPQEISRPIRKWLNAIATTAYENFGSWKDEDSFYLSVGDVTYDGIAFTNVVLRYNLSKGTWSVHTLAHKPLMGAIRITSTGARTVVIGDNDGQVHTWNSGYTDNGTNIYSFARTKELEFGSRSIKKTITRFMVYSTQPQGASIRCRVDGKKWINLGSLKKPTEVIKCNLSGYYFEFEVSLANSGVVPFVFDGIEFYEKDVYYDRTI